MTTGAAAAAQRGRRVVLRGKIVRTTRDDGVALCRSTLHVGTSPPSSAQLANAFDLEISGRIVQVDVPVLAPEAFLAEDRTARGTWAELSKEPLAAPFGGRGPGPHLSAKLVGAAALVGDPVTVAGEVSGIALEGQPGYREAGPEQVTEIRATHIALGSAGKELERQLAGVPLARTTPAKRWRPSGKQLVIVAVVLAVLGALVKALVTAPWLLAEWLGLVLAVGALAAGAGRDQDGIGVAELGDVWPEIVAGLALMLTVFGLLGTHYSAAVGDPPAGLTIAAIVGLEAAACWLALLGSWWASRAGNRYAQVVLAAPMHTAESEEGAWGASAGTVSDPTPVAPTGQAAALSRMSDGVVLLDDTFVLESAIGPIRVEPVAAVWSSWARRGVKELGGDRVVLEEVPVGARALVVGRLTRKDGERWIASTGPESVILFAVGADREPRAALEAWSRKGRVRLMIMAALAVITTAVAVLVALDA